MNLCDIEFVKIIHLCAEPFSKIYYENTIFTVKNSFVRKVKFGAFSRWAFGLNSTWGSNETTTIGKMHSTLLTESAHLTYFMDLNDFLDYKRMLLAKMTMKKIKMVKMILLQQHLNISGNVVMPWVK